MNLNRATLIAALSLASKVTPTTARLPILSHALLRCLPNQRLELVATNIETFSILEMPFTGEALAGLTLAPVAWLLKLLKSMDDDEIVMDRNTVNAITMYEGAEGDPKPEDFPTHPDPSGYTCVQIPGLTAAMQFAFDAASVDPTRSTINHVQVVATKKEITVNATDGHRMYRAWLPPAGVIVNKLIPSPLLEIPAKKLIPADQLFYGTGTHIALRVDGQGLTGWVISREVEGRFPNCDAVTPKDGSAVLQLALDPAPAIRLLKQAIALSTNGRQAMIDLVVRGGTLLLHPCGCNVELLVPGTKAGPDMIIGINGHYLQNALLAMTSSVITLRAEDPSKPIWFSEGRGKSRRVVVIMPMRTNYAGLQQIDSKPVAVESLPTSASA
jgi:DNA polymerase III sliding clamp (beta) subunit (PCNA family)